MRISNQSISSLEVDGPKSKPSEIVSTHVPVEDM